MLLDADSIQQCPYVVEQIHMDHQSPVEKKGRHRLALRERAPWPLSQGESTSTLGLTGFYWLSNSIHQRRFPFIMLRFALGDYFLQITKERMLLITSYRLTRKKCCKCKGIIRVIGLVTLHPWENQHRLQEVTLKICSKHLLLQLRVREF